MYVLLKNDQLSGLYLSSGPLKFTIRLSGNEAGAVMSPFSRSVESFGVFVSIIFDFDFGRRRCVPSLLCDCVSKFHAAAN